MKYILCVLALSLGVAYADVPSNLINQTYNGSTIKAGTYFNTAGSETKFINSAGTGITLNAGQNIRGVEMQTGYGGNIHIQAPDQVVKLNGNIDVRGLDYFNKPLDGGKVTVDAAYLYQNGNIYASGMRGGNVTMNVGGMTMGSGAFIDAHSTQVDRHMPGGSVTINATGQVDIQKGAKIDVTGATFDASGGGIAGTTYGNFSNIVISGKVVNMDGVLMANQARITDPNWMEESYQIDHGGGIRLVATKGDVTIGPDAIVQADAVEGSDNGRTITVTASNDINQNGLILSQGGDGTKGSIYYDTWYFDNMPLMGGKGGTIQFNAGHDINQNGRMVTDGGKAGVGYWGSDAGTMTFTATNNILNNGVIRSMGGNANYDINNPVPGVLNPLSDFHGGAGGNITFSLNPLGTGTVVSYGGQGSPFGALGTITSPNPIQSTNTLIGIWKKVQ
jgi:hypothetical protein